MAITAHTTAHTAAGIKVKLAIEQASVLTSSWEQEGKLSKPIISPKAVSPALMAIRCKKKMIAPAGDLRATHKKNGAKSHAHEKG